MGTEKEKVSGMDLIRWQNAQPDGFHGILTDPLGRKGFVSKIGGALGWFEIGQGQDEVEVMRAANALHDAMLADNTDRTYLKWLGNEVCRLSKPKTTDV